MRFTKSILVVLFILFAGILFSQTKSTSIQTINGKKYYVHKIEKGQSLYSIAKLYQVKLEDLYVENPELREGTKINQEIKIPYGSSTETKIVTSNTVASAVVAYTPVDTNKYSTYKVQKGETVYAITKKFNLSADYFEKLNPGSKSGIKEGQLVAIGERSPLKVPAAGTYTLTNKTRVDTAVPLKINFPKKNAYNLALILPFKLNLVDEIVPSNLIKGNLNFPQISSLAIDFYLGFKQAVDSLKSKDFDLNIELHDLDDKDSVNMVNILSSLSKKQTDFVFGPMYANGFKTISQKAKELNIPIVSPITQQNKFLYENIYASKTNPSQYTMIESLADYILDSLKPKKAKVILNIASEKDQKEMGFVKAFKQYYNEKARKLGYTLKDTVFVGKGIEGVKKNYSADMKNIVVSLSVNQVLITDFTTQLALFANKKDITLCGWQSTTSIDNIDQEYLNQLNYTFPSTNNITNTKAYDHIIQNYKALQNTYPSEFYFIGFDIALYYLKNLKTFGPDFIFRLNELPSETNYMRFKFTRPDNSTGFDNNGIYIFKYTNYQLVETGWK